MLLLALLALSSIVRCPPYESFDSILPLDSVLNKMVNESNIMIHLSDCITQKLPDLRFFEVSNIACAY